MDLNLLHELKQIDNALAVFEDLATRALYQARGAGASRD
jgi:hypothetical protein